LQAAHRFARNTPMMSIEISDQQTVVEFDAQRMRQAAESVLRDAGITEAQLSIAIVDDRTIQPLNRQYLQHDYATDVLSFVLEREGTRLDGEVIASAETAAQAAAQFDWSVDDELLLYVIHGTLHLVGHDDATPQQRAAMRRMERRFLEPFGLQRPDDPCDDASWPSADSIEED
jgi:probable rRNA maturation factor